MISEQDIDAIAQAARDAELGDRLTRELKAQWPDIHFTWCYDDDIQGARPVRQFKHFNLFLVTGAGGCLSFTSSPEQATGLVIAEIEQEWEQT